MSLIVLIQFYLYVWVCFESARIIFRSISWDATFVHIINRKLSAISHSSKEMKIHKHYPHKCWTRLITEHMMIASTLIWISSIWSYFECLNCQKTYAPVLVDEIWYTFTTNLAKHKPGMLNITKKNWDFCTFSLRKRPPFLPLLFTPFRLWINNHRYDGLIIYLNRPSHKRPVDKSKSKTMDCRLFCSKDFPSNCLFVRNMTTHCRHTNSWR